MKLPEDHILYLPLGLIGISLMCIITAAAFIFTIKTIVIMLDLAFG